MVNRYIAPDRRLGVEIRKLSRAAKEAQKPTGTERDRVLQTVLDQQVAILEAQVQLQAQQAEMLGRSSHQVSPSAVTLTYGTGYGEKGPSTRSFPFPAPQLGRRAATLIGSGRFEWAGGSSSAALGVYLRVELWQGSSMLWADVAFVTNDPFIPAAFNGDSFSLAASVRVPANDEPSFQLRVYGYRSADGGAATDGGRITNLSFTLQYGDRY